MTESLRFPARTVDGITVTATHPAGAVIPNTVTVKAGLGTAWRPPAEAALKACTWITGADVSRDFVLPVNPAVDGTPAGTYRVWFRLAGAGVDPLSPLVKAEGNVVIYGPLT